jgi:glycosyltransferase involved in cell wall biosynthesis
VSSDYKIDVVFIGRLHAERGIRDLIGIVKLLKARRPEITVMIVGEGPLRNEFEVEFAPWIKDSTISMPGFLSGSEILEIYSKSKVLLSTAPREGYGLTLREAVLSNVYVVARESKGALEAQSAFPTAIETYIKINEAAELIFSNLGKPKLKPTPEYSLRQVQMDAEGVNRLTQSWLKN